MGLFFSCCRRCDRRSAEREPLLPKHRVADVADAIKPTQAQLNKIADILGALKTGKLPSNIQAGEALRRFLASDALNDRAGISNYGPLSDHGKEIVRHARSFVEAVLQFNDEKNGDNIVQDLLFQYSQISNNELPVHADVAVEGSSFESSSLNAIATEIPSTDEMVDDASTLACSLTTITRVLLTSSAFRTLLTELVSIARDVVGDVVGNAAAKVERAAEVVQDTAQTVGHTARNVEAVVRSGQTEEQLGTEPTMNPGLVPQDGQSSTSGSWDIVSNGDLDRLKITLIKRIQQVMLQVQTDSASRSALNVILLLLRKYVTKLDAASSLLTDPEQPRLVPLVWADPPLAQCLSDLGTFMSRISSNHPLEPFTGALYLAVYDLVKLPLVVASDGRQTRNIREFMTDLGDWFDSSLTDTRYITSPEGKMELEELYDRAHTLIDQATREGADWIQHVRALIREADAFIAALESDATTNRLVTAFSGLSSSLASITQRAVTTAPSLLGTTKKKIQDDLRRDLFCWLLPRLTRAARVIPMPRLEYSSTSPNLDVAIDALYLMPTSAQASLVPDHITACQCSEVQLDVIETDNFPGNPSPPVVPSVANTGMRTCTRLHVYADGVRLSVRDVGYYVSWRAFKSRWLGWLGYEDQGLLSLDLGRRGVHGDGLRFDFELEYTSDADLGAGGELGEFDSLFKVAHVHTTLHGLHLSLDHSKHWILNKFILQPLARPLGSLAAGWVLRRQLQSVLEAVGRIGMQTKREAQSIIEDAEQEIEIADYAAALWRVLVGSAEATEDGGDEDDSEEAPVTDSRTRLTTKGIVRHSVTYATEASSSSPHEQIPADESVLAAGIGAQILPGKGGPYSESGADDGYGPRDVAREGLDEVQSRFDQVEEAGEEVVHHAAELRRNVEIASERGEERVDEERRRRFWRSRAFDW